MTRARAALAASVADIGHHRYAKAVTHLRTLKIQVRKAHTGATALIGKPPTDPESDDPPGVNAVLKVSGLEHKITMQLVPLFNHLSRSSVVAPLGYTLNVTDACRDVMLGKVISLKAGARDDYSDGLSDTLPGYKAELNAFSTALSTYTMTTRGRHALTHAKGVVTGTNDAMRQVFGGGERSPA